VESVIGKAGRANTPTDPAPLDMVETLVNYRPKTLWPKRVLKYADAVAQTRRALTALEQGEFVARDPHEDEHDALINDSAQKALERFDETMRDLALIRYQEFERSLGPVLTRFAVTETVSRIKNAVPLSWHDAMEEEKTVADLAEKLTPDFGPWLSKHPS